LASFSTGSDRTRSNSAAARSVPDFFHTSNNFAQVSRWWAALVDPAIKDG